MCVYTNICIFQITSHANSSNLYSDAVNFLMRFPHALFYTFCEFSETIHDAKFSSIRDRRGFHARKNRRHFPLNPIGSIVRVFISYTRRATFGKRILRLMRTDVA